MALYILLVFFLAVSYIHKKQISTFLVFQGLTRSSLATIYSASIMELPIGAYPTCCPAVSFIKK